jgi:predicted DNA-binding protein (MmcQ/YjbR family)
MSESSSRLKFPAVSEEMKAWSAALAAEVASWPQLSSRSFFGFTALYRRDKIFGLLPRTRGMHTANSLAFKLESPSSTVRERLERDSRVGATHLQKARWFTYELSSDSDLHEALEWLGKAYDVAAKGKSPK